MEMPEGERTGMGLAVAEAGVDESPGFDGPHPARRIPARASDARKKRLTVVLLPAGRA
jgi:hypothetical protein